MVDQNLERRRNEARERMAKRYQDAGMNPRDAEKKANDKMREHARKKDEKK